MSKLKTLSMLAAVQALTGVSLVTEGKKITFTEKNKEDYRDQITVGLGPKEAAYMACKMCPIASKLSANRRYIWQRFLIEEME